MFKYPCLGVLRVFVVNLDCFVSFGGGENGLLSDLGRGFIARETL